MIETKELGCVFSYNHLEIGAYTVRGTFAGELETTKELLAAEEGIPAWAINTTYVYR